LQHELCCSQSDVGNFCTALSELCHNVRDHSQGHGLAIVQVYKPTAKKQFVILSVADDGQGIKSSLAERFTDSMPVDDGEAIRRALEKEFSRFQSAGRGYGLFRVKQIVSKYDGSLTIRSGKARLFFRDRYLKFSTCEWPGTQVGISLRAH
jgi:sensor histidine kinase regulating citrate/malate metabolism